MRGLFITGTDTNVGKTVVSAALALRLSTGRRVGYWKPVQTGIEQDDDTGAVAQLARLDEPQIAREGVRLPRPVSPHLAARLEGRTISLEQLLEAGSRLAQDVCWLIEGAGGILVPLNDDDQMIDLIGALRIPAVVAARTTLGTINHTLLTVEALRHRSIPVAGVVMVGDHDADNEAAIAHYGEVPVLGTLPWLTPLTHETLAVVASSLDRDRRLEVWLT